MPTSDSTSTSRRLLALLSLLQSRRDWPAPVLARRLGISERTVRRDVDRLRELDYAIQSTRGPDGGYRLGAGSELPPLLLDDEQAVAVAIALRSAAATGADIDDAADRALQTIARIMPNRLAQRIGGLAESASADARGSTNPRVDPDVLMRIGDAIRAHEEVRFDYASPGAPARQDPAPRRIEPHHLVLHGGRWYLIGFAADRGAWRTYRADRMRLRSHTGRRFEPRDVPGGDPARWLAARFTGAEDADTWPCWGEVAIAAPLSEVVPYLGDGTAEELDADRCRIRIGAWSWMAVAATLARFDADLTEVEPEQLRDAFTALAHRAARAAGSVREAGTGSDAGALREVGPGCGSSVTA